MLRAASAFENLEVIGIVDQLGRLGADYSGSEADSLEYAGGRIDVVVADSAEETDTDAKVRFDDEGHW